ncbi:winged helix-turn-helix transcriptional regulator [Chelativorans intermedius]|uniref:Winged helix-turn-helix transcriptional regulator n=1 Tax=Chelativorans intermedius TaxID=515947 RepID=A0ABV6D360_9HYPH|nr:helix-turn-helix domain-containing protein [Chelativorans intermedius]MCT8998423.1 helix-turn-helix transcriptional regulator [Chelativorans intermedius]
MKPGHPDHTDSVNLQHERCRPVHEILSLVGDKWSVLIVRFLGQKTMRFNELRRAIDGISQKMLTTTLRNLERDGFVTRTVYPTIPPRVEYTLTDLGRELLVPVAALAKWVDINRERIDEARRRFDEQWSEPAVRIPAAPGSAGPRHREQPSRNRHG